MQCKTNCVRHVFISSTPSATSAYLLQLPRHVRQAVQRLSQRRCLALLCCRRCCSWCCPCWRRCACSHDRQVVYTHCSCGCAGLEGLLIATEERLICARGLGLRRCERRTILRTCVHKGGSGALWQQQDGAACLGRHHFAARRACRPAVRRHSCGAAGRPCADCTWTVQQALIAIAGARHQLQGWLVPYRKH